MEFKKILYINLLVLLGYNVLIHVFSTGGSQDYGLIIGLCMSVIFHCAILLILSIIFFVQKDNKRGKNILLVGFIIAIVGFSTCFGGLQLRDGLSLQGFYLPSNSPLAI